MLMKKRISVALLACGAFTFSTAALADAPNKPDRIVVNASGGTQAETLRKAYWDGFTELTGINVIDTSPVDFSKLRAMVMSHNIQWAMTEIGGQDALRAVDLGLTEAIDEKVVDRSEFFERARHPNVFASNVFATAKAFRTDAFTGDTPETWKDFWDVQKFPGPRAMRNHPIANLEAALMADGVAKDQIYPIDYDRAFKKLDEIYPHVAVWWTTGQQPAQLLADKEVVMATGWTSRFYGLIRKGAPITVKWDGALLHQTSWVIPKGAKDAQWAQQLFAIMTDPKRQALYAITHGSSGTNKRSNDYVPEDIRPLLPLSPENEKQSVWADVEWWTEHGAEASKRWNEWMLSKQ